MRVTFLSQFVTLRGDFGAQNLRLAPSEREDLTHQIAYLLVSLLIKHQHRRTRAAQRTAEQPGSAELYHLVQARYQRISVGLMQAVLQRRRKSRGRARG